jgi:acyl-coenzyme A synthetase/AMP-(fatty) acid ligase/acyl carrier protein
MNEHRGVVNRLLWAQREYSLSAQDRLLQKTPFSFDVSVWELFLPWFSGAQLIVAQPHAHQDPHALIHLIEHHAVTTLHFVPSMLPAFLDVATASNCRSLRRVVCSGEALSSALQKRFHAQLPNVALFNHYGPTEAAIDVTSWRCSPADTYPSVPIGRPIDNTAIYVLDAQLQPVPIGVPGELYIGGVGVARGYLNRPELTAERFVHDPFAGTPDARMYKTGDLARYRHDGLIEYLGRNDFQVKLRGFRIELGEIEAQLLGCAGVHEAVVIAREDAPGDKRLVAYLVAEKEHNLDISKLRQTLSARLPEYMIPAAFVQMEQLPLTANGKLDRKALPAPGGQAYLARVYEPAQGPVEQALAEIWQQLLGVERVGRQDHFFELGGHSLLAVQLVTRIREHFRLSVPLKALFEHPVLSGLGDLITSSQLALFADDEIGDLEKELDSLSESDLLAMLSKDVAHE